MNYRIRYTEDARLDLIRLHDFVLEISDGNFQLADRALDAIERGICLLEQSPFSCRKTTPEDPLLRELLIPFGASGYLALFKISDAGTITIISVRHQREDDYH